MYKIVGVERIIRGINRSDLWCVENHGTLEDVNSVDRQGQLPLYVAATHAKNRKTSLLILLKRGADLMAFQDGKTVLEHLIAAGRVDWIADYWRETHAKAARLERHEKENGPVSSVR